MSKTRSSTAAPRGGRRAGSGRKPTIPAGARLWQIAVTDEERDKAQLLIRALRGQQRTADIEALIELSRSLSGAAGFTRRLAEVMTEGGEPASE